MRQTSTICDSSSSAISGRIRTGNELMMTSFGGDLAGGGNRRSPAPERENIADQDQGHAQDRLDRRAIILEPGAQGQSQNGEQNRGIGRPAGADAPRQGEEAAEPDDSRKQGQEQQRDGVAQRR